MSTNTLNERLILVFDKRWSSFQFHFSDKAPLTEKPKLDEACSSFCFFAFHCGKRQNRKSLNRLCWLYSFDYCEILSFTSYDVSFLQLMDFRWAGLP